MADTDTDTDTDTTESLSISIDTIATELKQHKQEFDTKISLTTTVAQAEALRVEYLGKKGPINKVMSYMRLLSNADKPKLGAVVNEIKDELETVVNQRKEEMELLEIEKQMEGEKLDVTIPGLPPTGRVGRRHPLSMTMEKAVDIFVSLGYDTVTECKDSPEIETDYYCFEALNCPKDHPARDMQDTFYLTEDMGNLLRTHTSSVQIRQLATRKPPLRIVAPGRVYRKDDIDATHSMIFHQIEILALDEKGKLNLGHLKGTVEHFLKEMFGPEISVRFRGSYFPFTEPSMEVDVYFRGKWLEVLGCGMVDPNVIKMAGLDPDKISGFAAGFGVERFAMVIHGINDIREFYKNDIRFLDQFPTFYDEGLTSLMKGDVGRGAGGAVAEKEKAQLELQTHYGALQAHRQFVQSEIQRCRNNMTVLQAHQSQLHGDRARSSFSEAEVSASAQLERYAQLLDEIDETVEYVQEVLQAAASKNHPQGDSMVKRGQNGRPRSDPETESLLELERRGATRRSTRAS